MLFYCCVALGVLWSVAPIIVTVIAVDRWMGQRGWKVAPCATRLHAESRMD